MVKSTSTGYRYRYAGTCSKLVMSCIKKYLTIIFLFLLSGSAFSQAVSTGVAQVTPPVTGFGIDGNLKANVPTSGVGDWLPNTAANGGVLTSAGVPVDATKTYHSTDLFSNGDNIFVGGLKKDGDLTKYTWKNGSPSPSKCDINHLLVHIADDASGDTWITLAGDRQAVNGNSFISIALLQKTLTANTDKTFTSGAPSSTGGRTEGDVQISAEFTGGGVNPNLYLEEWRNVNGTYKWVSFSITPMPAYGSTNAASITGMPYDVFGTNTYGINAFIEVSFNISAIYRNTSTACVGSIASMFVMTKSSQSVTADLADFVDPLQINLDINVGKPTASGSTYCVGQTIQNLTATGETGATFKWYTAIDGNGKPTGTPSIGANYSTGIDNTKSGTYDYYVTQSLKGCESQPTKVTVTVNPNATASAGNAPTAQCYDAANGNTFSLTGTGTNGTPSWAVAPNGNPNNLTVQITGGSTLTPSVKVSGGTGSVTLRLTVTSTYTPSCGTPTSDVTVTVNPNATANAGTAPTAKCYDATNGSTFSLDGSGSNGTPKWTVFSNSNNLTVTFSDDAIYKPDVTIKGGTGSVTLRLTVTSGYTPSCGTPTSDVTVTVNPRPTADAGTDPTTQCYVASGNTFSLTGTGTNGTPSWAVAPNGNPSNLTVQISDGNTLTPSVKLSGNTNGGTVTLRLTVTSNTTPACGTATNDVDLKVNAQVGGPNAEMLPITCADKFFKVKIIGPDNGTTYTITQPNNNKVFAPITGELDNTNKVKDVIFEGLIFGDGYRIVASKNGCESSPTICEGSTITNGLTTLKTEQAKITNEGPAKARNESIYLGENNTNVTAVPNPYNDRIRFNLQSAVTGQGSLELYNMMGQKVKTLYQGYIEAGRIKSIEYNVPNAQRSNLIYLFKVGDQRASGKLIH